MAEVEQKIAAFNEAAGGSNAYLEAMQLDRHRCSMLHQADLLLVNSDKAEPVHQAELVTIADPQVLIAKPRMAL